MVSPDLFRAACDIVADPVAICLRSALVVSDWQGLGKCCVGVTRGGVCEQFIESCHNCAENPLETPDCALLIRGIISVLQISQTEAVAGFKAVCNDYSSAALMLACTKLDEGKYDESEAGMSKTEAKDKCDASCNSADTKPNWCHSGLSAGAVAGIVVACVVVVAAGAIAAWYFLLRKANAGSSSVEAPEK
jgi:hypothetical protein